MLKALFGTKKLVSLKLLALNMLSFKELASSELDVLSLVRQSLVVGSVTGREEVGPSLATDGALATVCLCSDDHVQAPSIAWRVQVAEVGRDPAEWPDNTGSLFACVAVVVVGFIDDFVNHPFVAAVVSFDSFFQSSNKGVVVALMVQALLNIDPLEFLLDEVRGDDKFLAIGSAKLAEKSGEHEGNEDSHVDEVALSKVGGHLLHSLAILDIDVRALHHGLGDHGPRVQGEHAAVERKDALLCVDNMPGVIGGEETEDSLNFKETFGKVLHRDSHVQPGVDVVEVSHEASGVVHHDSWERFGRVQLQEFIFAKAAFVQAHRLVDEQATDLAHLEYRLEQVNQTRGIEVSAFIATNSSDDTSSEKKSISVSLDHGADNPAVSVQLDDTPVMVFAEKKSKVGFPVLEGERGGGELNHSRRISVVFVSIIGGVLACLRSYGLLKRSNHELRISNAPLLSHCMLLIIVALEALQLLERQEADEARVGAKDFGPGSVVTTLCQALLATMLPEALGISVQAAVHALANFANADLSDPAQMMDAGVKLLFVFEAGLQL